MTSPVRAKQHARVYFFFVAAGLSAMSVLTLWVASFLVTREWTPLNPLLVTVIVLSTSFVFYRYHLLLTARETSYMLSRAVPQWLQAMLYISLAYAVLPDVGDGVSQPVYLAWVTASLPVTLITLAVMRYTATRVYATDEQRRDTIFIDPGPESLLLAKRMKNSPVLGFSLVGYYGDPEPDTDELAAVAAQLHCLGGVEEARHDLHTGEYEAVFVSLNAFRNPEWVEIIDVIADTTASIYVVPEARALANNPVVANTIAGIPVLTVHETPIIGMARMIKRTMDIVISALALIVLSPLMLLIALAVRLSSPGPILFSQIRYGHSGQAIRVYKFRTMYVHKQEGNELKQATRDDPRITPVGRILRRFSLDELPQLLNVLTGEMSLVGPRPHAAEHNELYRKLIHGYMLRYSVKPGITGWAQVNGLRGETDTVEKMAQRVEFDRYYIQNWSLWLDIRILFQTAIHVIFNKTAY